MKPNNELPKTPNEMVQTLRNIQLATLSAALIVFLITLLIDVLANLEIPQHPMAISYSINPDHQAAYIEAWRQATPSKVEAWLKGGADLHERNANGATTLMFASRFASPEVIKTLLEAGADVQAQDNKGWTVLQHAVGQNENLDVITMLLQAGADLGTEKTSGTPVLVAACGHKNPDIFTLLLAAGADVNARDKDHATALMCVVQFDWKPESAKRLLEAGADVNARSDSGRTALLEAAAYDPIYRFALEVGTGGDERAAYSEYILAEDNREMIKLLVAAEAEVNAQDDTGRSVLMAVAERRFMRLETLALFLELGADANLQNQSGETALMFAVKKGYQDATQYLSEVSEVNAQNASGRTALMLAVAGQQGEIVKTLLVAGADPMIQDTDGNTALSEAKAKFSDIVPLLLEASANDD